jgi:ribonuclease HI
MGNSLRIFTDGGARGNPGPAASAFAMFDKEKLIYKDSKYLGVATNNVAEYNAVLLAYNYLLANKISGENLDFFLDSELVVNQLKGNYKIKKDALIKLATSIKSLEKLLKFKKISYTFVRREQNVFADKLVNICIDENDLISR